MKLSRSAGRTERFRRKRSRKSRRPLAIAGIVAFLAVDVALVGYAFVSGRSASADISGPLGVSTSPSAEQSDGPTPSTSTAPADDAARGAERLVSTISDTTAWRATAGTCTVGGDEQALVERTTDAGESWTTHGVPGLSSIVRVSATSADEVFVVGQRTGTCEMTLAVTYTAGAAFVEHPDDLTSAWYIDPADSPRVHSPNDTLEAPCADVLELGVVSASEASVRCGDGSLLTTRTGGSSWIPRDVQGDLLALSTDGSVVLASDGSSCLLVPTSAGAALAAPDGACTEGPIGLAVSDTKIWIWSGQTISTVARA